MTWRQVIMSDKHGLGSELIEVSSLKTPLPLSFEGNEKVMVMRYDGRLPMAGIRINDIYHLLWLEPSYGALYSHG